MFVRTLVGYLASASALSSALQHNPYDSFGNRHLSPNVSALRIDLGYEIYDGFVDSQSGLHTWKG
jgi:hypothetical protein